MSPSPTIPSPRTLLTNIFSPLPQEQQPSSGTLSSSLKSTLLTLHILFPNELLPALDLLDRPLITKFIVQDSQQPSDTSVANTTETTEMDHQSPSAPTSPPSAQTTSPSNPPPSNPAKPSISKTPLYYVTSSQTQIPFNPRHGGPENQPTHYYEVRPSAWNCSCPAFAFSAFPASNPPTSSNHSSPTSPISPKISTRHYRNPSISDDKSEEETWGFGGLSLAEEVPMCKHLLACIMVERWEGFGENVEEREISIEELAGWGAGWGG